MKQQYKYELNIKAMIGNKETLGIIDYDSQFASITSFTIKNQGIIIRNKGVISFLPTLIIPDDTQKLITISLSQNGYDVITDAYNHEDTMNSNEGWLVYKLGMFPEKNNKDARHELHIGDIIKIGQVKLRVKHINFKSCHNTIDEHRDCTTSRKANDYHHNNTFSMPQIIQVKANQSTKKMTNRLCRICLGNDNDQTEEDYDPLIQPCQCSGTMKDIHLNCLRHWLQSKIITKIDEHEGVITYLIKQVECELCTSKLPDYIKHNNDYLEIINFDIKQENYIILETKTINHKGNKYVFIVSFDNKDEVTLGRGYDCDIVLPESSVSRLHGAFIKERNRLYLEDCNSKFGSMVLIQAPQLRIADGIPLNVQIGRTFLAINLQSPFRLFGCCFSQEYNSNGSYQSQNRKYLNLYRESIVKEEKLNDESDSNDISEYSKAYLIIGKDNKMIKRKSEQSEHFLKVIETIVNNNEEEQRQEANANVNDLSNEHMPIRE